MAKPATAFVSNAWPPSIPLTRIAVRKLSLTNSSPIPPPCSPAINSLLSGIEINILAQWGEKNATIALQAIESRTPINKTEFGSYFSQYAAAEETELELAKSLTGDPSHDSPILATLVSDVTTGIQLNGNNTIAGSFVLLLFA
ncbi:hypothetical protein E2P81_ATG11397 [Venturia nashicola]|nr:hypothetical protein E2P81_ATG11397 [Venturia nashicola]